jgi:hypothetical protein
MSVCVCTSAGASVKPSLTWPALVATFIVAGGITVDRPASVVTTTAPPTPRTDTSPAWVISVRRHPDLFFHLAAGSATTAAVSVSRSVLVDHGRWPAYLLVPQDLLDRDRPVAGRQVHLGGSRLDRQRADRRAIS